MDETDRIEVPRLFPTRRCRDTAAMIRWLIDVLGFTERVVYRQDGVINHAEFAFGSAMLMLGQSRDDDHAKEVEDLAGRRTDAICVAVDDPDRLHAKVVASGAEIVRALHETDYGSRDFTCRDPEGDFWSFGTYWPKVHETPLAESSSS